MSTELSTVEIQPQAEHRYTVIWLHGLGADGHDFEGIVPELHLHAATHTHFIFPNAPVQPVTINGGAKMRAWYDIVLMSLERKPDVAGIGQSATLLTQLIAQEMAKGIASENILLAGFSQGGVIALQTGLTFPHKLAGIIALSTYLPTLAQLSADRTEANQATPVFIGHGILDSVVAVESGKAVYNALKELGYPAVWHDYPFMAHSVCPEEIAHLSAFINGILK